MVGWAAEERDACLHAFALCILNVPIPDVDAGIAKADLLETFACELLGFRLRFVQALHATGTYRCSKVRLSDVDSQILHRGAETAGSVVGDLSACFERSCLCVVGFQLVSVGHLGAHQDSGKRFSWGYIQVLVLYWVRVF